MKAKNLKKGLNYRITRSNHLTSHFKNNTEITVSNIKNGRIYWEAKNGDEDDFDMGSQVDYETEFELITSNSEQHPLIFN